MPYALPTPPNTGMVLDRDGIEWRVREEWWTALPCPQCSSQLGTMSWPELLQNRGPLTDVPVSPEGGAAAAGAA